MTDCKARVAIYLLKRRFEKLERTIKMDFTALNGVVTALGTDVSAEIATAVAVIQAAKATSTNTTDQAALDGAVAALQNVDTIVKTATANFTAPVVSTSTSS